MKWVEGWFGYILVVGSFYLCFFVMCVGWIYFKGLRIGWGFGGKGL